MPPLPSHSWSLACTAAGQGTGQCPTHFSQATSETRLFRRTLTCRLYRFGFEIPNGCDAKYKSKKSREKKIGRPAKAVVVHEPKG